jgi:hypothetical protein
MDPEEVTTVTQYRGHLDIPDKNGIALCEFVSDELDPIKEKIQRVLAGGAEFELAQGRAGGRLLLVFHPNHHSGKKHLGWISTFEVPEEMSARNQILNRLQAA